MIKRRQKGEDFKTPWRKRRVCVTITIEAVKLMNAKMCKHPSVWYSPSHFVECAIRRQAAINIHNPKSKKHKKGVRE
jgi:hypothetical protein